MRSLDAAMRLPTAARAHALLRLARWENVLISAAGVLVGAVWASAPTEATNYAALAAAGLTVLANADNDATDIAVDRVAHPARPLPSGSATIRDVRRLVAAGAIVGVVASFAVSAALAVVSALVIALMLAYNRVLKRHGPVGNLCVAVLASLPFLYGAHSAGDTAAALPLLAMAIPLHLAREIAKDVDDAAGDSLDRRTLPAMVGQPRSRATAIVAVIAFVVLALLYAARTAQPLFALALVPAFLVAGIACVRLARSASSGGASSLLKRAMLCAMAGVIVTRAFR